MNHTQGKWETNGCAIYTESTKIAHTNEAMYQHTGATAKMQAEAEANARLIAAAPELLELANFISLRLGDVEGTRELTATEFDILDKANAAIKKVTPCN